MTLGESIYYYRKRAGLSQEELAARVGVSRQAVSRWELGDTTPEVGKLVALAEAFGVTTDQLLSGKAPEEEIPAAETPGKAAAPAATEGDKLPGFLARMIRRHGWLAGVYIALQGLGTTVVGILARSLFSKIFQVTLGEFSSMVPGGALVTDSAGNPISLPPEAMEAIYGELGMGFDGFASGQVTAISETGQIFVGFATVIMVIGILVMAAGAILAVYLRQKGREEKEIEP